jgi:protein-L-isoaspartate(D-aspartate) O-methyltransferase
MRRRLPTAPALVALAALVHCGPVPEQAGRGPHDEYAAARNRMVERQIRARGVEDARVLGALAAVPRHLFVPADVVEQAYDDHPLPIGHGQTISQPYVVALMTELADLRPGERALEVGTGSGYQAAVLAALADSVYTVEIVEPLAASAADRLRRLGYANVRVRWGDGYRGWPERAPFDAIVVTAAPERVPQPLLDQLAVGGRLVIPVGGASQDLLEITRTADGLVERNVIPVRFVPMTGEAQRRGGGGR